MELCVRDSSNSEWIVFDANGLSGQIKFAEADIRRFVLSAMT